MKRYLFGAIALLALMIGAFLLPSQTTHAESLTTYQRALPAERLANLVPTTIATLPFQVDRHGIFYLTSSQEANIGNPAGGNISQWQSISVTVNLDGRSIATETIGSTRWGPPLTQIGILLHQRISKGYHLLTLVYVSTPEGHLNGCANFNYPLNCETAYLHSGKLFMRVID